MSNSRWTVVETCLHSARQYEDPLWDVDVEVQFVSPSGTRRTADAFWDGGRSWRVRFCPDEVGRWNWRSECSDPSDQDLHGETGAFDCRGYAGDNPLYRHGPIRLSDDGRHFTHADGTPFFWLGDTAWNGPIRAKDDEWNTYLEARGSQGFTGVQFVSTQWRAAPTGPHGDTAYTVGDRIAVDPAWFQRLDPRVAAINEHGLVAAPVILWAYGQDDPGRVLSEDDAVRLARYIVARWDAYHVMWLLGGDGDYRGELAERWKRIGTAVFEGRRGRLVTMHPMGQTWVADEFREAPWYDVVGYQSSHSVKPEHLRWLVSGPPAHEWLSEPRRPIVNLEPNYEAIRGLPERRPVTDAEVRRAVYWSLLNTPTAGVTYGHNHIWPWAAEQELAPGHEALGTVGPWSEALDTPGSRCMSILRRFFDSLPWWRLRPAQELLARGQPAGDPRGFVTLAASEDGCAIVGYLPAGGTVQLHTERVRKPAGAYWFDPRTGTRTERRPVTEAVQEFVAPDAQDWVLDIRAEET